MKIIVLDLDLPDGNGWDMLEVVHAAQLTEADPKMIVLGGHEQDAPQAQNCIILPKPIQAEALIRLAIQLRYERNI